MTEETPTIDQQRCGFVALIGAPNAGKSTLLNQLVGMKLAIVTHKVQTTRTRITGAIIEGDSQIIFVDTPGIFKPKRRLDRAMVNTAWRGAGDADLVALLIDAAEGITEEVEAIIESMVEAKQKAYLVLNKIDAVKREKLLELTMKLNEAGIFEETFMISALKGDGVADLRKVLASRVPLGPWHYPEDHLTDISLRAIAAEITREKIYLRLHQELPYAASVLTEQWKEQKDGSVRIEQTIFIQRESQKPIVIGKGGRTLKKLGELARHEMEDVFQMRIHLFLHVKVSENWADNPWHYQEMGIDFTE